MSILKTTPVSEATGLTARIYHGEITSLGYVPSHIQAMAMNPEAAQAFQALEDAIVNTLGLRRYELVALAAAQAIGSTHCRLAHGLKALKVFDEAELILIARDYHNAGLTEAEVAMMAYAERLSSNAAGMAEADTAKLAGLGFTDREIVDITLAASARNFYGRALLALDVDLDIPPTLSPELLEALLSPLKKAHGSNPAEQHGGAAGTIQEQFFTQELEIAQEGAPQTMPASPDGDRPSSTL